LLWGVPVGFLGFCLLLLGLVVSAHVPGLPVAAGNYLLHIAATGRGATIPTWLAAQVFSEGVWYERAVLPALVGIIEGFVVGLFRRMTIYELLVAGLAITSLLVMVSLIPGSFQGTIGPALFHLLPFWLDAHRGRFALPAPEK
jgi:hypothetical protein